MTTPPRAGADDDIVARYHEAVALEGASPAPGLRAAVLARAHNRPGVGMAPEKEAVGADGVSARAVFSSEITRPAANDRHWLISAVASVAVLGIVGLLALQLERGGPAEQASPLGQPPVAGQAAPAPSLAPAPAPAPVAAAVPPAPRLAESAGHDRARREMELYRRAPAAASMAPPEPAEPAQPAQLAQRQAAQPPRSVAAPAPPPVAAAAPAPIAAARPPPPVGASTQMARAEQSEQKINRDALQQSLSQRLLAAAASGQADAVRDALARGAPVNAADSAGRTALMLAAGRGDAASARLLIAAHADLHRADRAGLTATAHARRAGHAALAREIEEAASGRRR